MNDVCLLSYNRRICSMTTTCATKTTLAFITTIATLLFIDLPYSLFAEGLARVAVRLGVRLIEHVHGAEVRAQLGLLGVRSSKVDSGHCGLHVLLHDLLLERGKAGGS